MLNEKNTTPEDLNHLLLPIIGLVDMIRIAIDPQNIDRAIVLAKAIKTMGFEVGFNVMYMSKWAEMNGFLSKLKAIDKNLLILFCRSILFGGITPKRSEKIYLKKYVNILMFPLDSMDTTTYN